MKHEFPNYYHKFSCVAGACEATCCAGWQIVVDEASLKKYKKVTGAFKERMETGVDFKEGVFFQKEKKRCAFLNDRNLCDMFTALGEDSLCETCTRYPRHIEEFENVREHTLSVSCPEVAKILLSEKEPVQFSYIVEESEEELFDDFDPMLYEALTEARDGMMAVLQDRTLSPELRAATLWDFIIEFQEKMDEGTLYMEEDFYEICREGTEGGEAIVLHRRFLEKAKAQFAELSEHETVYFERAKEQFALLLELEFLSEEWEKDIKEAMRLLYGKGADSYKKLRSEYIRWRTENIPDWDIIAEQLLVYFLYTYFCGAVYDEYVASKVKLSALSVFYVEEMLIAQWIKQGKGLVQQDIVRMVYRYSRELEHSDENLYVMNRLLEELK